MKRMRGFTLLEIVIALAILSIGLVGVLSLFPVGFQASRRASMLTESTIFAQQKLEELKEGGYDTLVSGGGPSGWSDFPDPNDPSGSTPSGVQWQTTISDVNPPGNLKQIILEVKWKEEGADRIETFVTYVADLSP